MEKVKLALIIESEGAELTGRVTYNDNLIVDSAQTLPELERNLKNLLFEFEGLKIETVEFEHFYDVFALFNKFDWLKISKVAEHAGINPGLLRQYASQIKYPSAVQAKKIENAIHQLATQMMQASVYVAD